VLDPAAHGEKSLEASCNFRLDFLRGHAIEKRRHHNFRDLDCGKQVDWHTHHTRGAYDRDD
jgi:hypothetical protein